MLAAPPVPEDRSRQIRRNAAIDVLISAGLLVAACYAWLVRGISPWIVVVAAVLALVEIAEAVYNYRWIWDSRLRTHTFAWMLLFRVAFAGLLAGFVAFFGFRALALGLAFAAYWIGDPVVRWALWKHKSATQRRNG